MPCSGAPQSYNIFFISSFQWQKWASIDISSVLNPSDILEVINEMFVYFSYISINEEGCFRQQPFCSPKLQVKFMSMHTF